MLVVKLTANGYMRQHQRTLVRQNIFIYSLFSFYFLLVVHECAKKSLHVDDDNDVNVASVRLVTGFLFNWAQFTIEWHTPSSDVHA